jgi:hypothetical protein
VTPAGNCKGNGQDRPRCQQPTVLPTTVTPPGGLAFTGADNPVPWALAALVLLVTGLYLVRRSYVRGERG